MRTHLFASVRTVVLVLALLALSLVPCEAARFSAELTVTSHQGNFVYDMSVADDWIWLKKTAGPMTVPPFPTLYNRKTGITTGIMPQARQYVEETDPARAMVMNPVAGWEYMRKEMTATPAGTETVEGYTCDRIEYREPGKDTVAFRVWKSRQLAFAVKTVSYATNGNAVMALRHIKEGPVDDALFRIPEGYTRMGPAAGAAAAPAQPPTGRAEQGSASGNLVFILDASGSMWGQVEGTAKIAIAKKVLAGLVEELPEDAVVGLVAYGHRRKGDCDDVEELMPIGPLKSKKMIARIQALNPKGKTPISRAVRLTAQRIKHLEDETTIILVSDGKETCDPDPCGLVRELKEAGIRFVMHVIGFDVTEEEREQLECMAQAGGGEYFTAKTASDFQLAAKEVVKKASDKPPIALTVACVKENRPFKAHVRILTQEGNTAAEGWSGKEQPAAFRLPPGLYAIHATDTGVVQRPEVRIEGVQVVEGQVTERVATFGQGGLLQVKAIKDSAPMKAYVKVFLQEDDAYMGDGWTREDGTPAEYKLLPGTYRIEVQDKSVKQRPVINIRDVAVQPGATVERVATFGQGGLLQVKALKDSAPMKAYVKVFHQEDDAYMGDGWTREDGTPAEYKLLPGTYRIEVQDKSVKQRPVISIRDVAVQPGATVERFASFVAGGVLKVTASRNGSPCKAYVKLFQQKDDLYLGDGWTREDGTPVTYKLQPGVYTVRVQDRQEKSEQEIRDIGLESGRSVTVNAAFPLEAEAAVPQPAAQPEASAPQEPDEAPVIAPAESSESAGSGDMVLGGKVPLMEGAAVSKQMTYGPNSTVELEITASPQEVVDFYRKALTAQGWQAGMSMMQGPAAVLQLIKGESQLMIQAKEKGQKTMVNLMLMKK
jgi:Ca-activated chloride channel family protein